jgi:hypothetical protein
MVNLKVRMGNVGGEPEYAKHCNQQIEYGEEEARTVAHLLPLAPHHDAASQADDQTDTDERYGYDGMHLYTLIQPQRYKNVSKRLNNFFLSFTFATIFLKNLRQQDIVFKINDVSLHTKQTKRTDETFIIPYYNMRYSGPDDGLLEA